MNILAARIYDLQLRKSSHVNEMPFKGVLVLLDKPSDQSPQGAEGHKILVPKDVAKRRLKTLVNMGLNYKPTLDAHAPRRKVGVITGAKLQGDKVLVEGVIWKKDFPEAERDIKGRSLGMSMELANIEIRDKDEDVWHLSDFEFTGATILKNDSAAYRQTALAASKDPRSRPVKEGDQMAKKTTKTSARRPASTRSRDTQLVQQIAAEQAKVLSAGLNPVLEAMQASTAAMSTLARQIALGNRKRKPSLAATARRAKSELDRVLAGEGGPDAGHKEAEDALAQGDEEDEEDMESEAEDEEDVEAEGEDEEDEMESEGDEDEEDVEAEGDEDEEDVEAEGDEEDEEDVNAEEETEPGKINKKANDQQGDKTTVTASRMRSRRRFKKSSIRSMAAAARQITTLRAELAKERKGRKRMGNRVRAMEAQMERMAEQTERRTVSPELSMILQKSGYSVPELMASGTVLEPEEVNEMLDKAGVELDPTTRIAIKHQLEERGLMSHGEIRR